MALCFRYREAMTAGHDAVTFEGMIMKTVLMAACVVALVGCATPPGKLTDADFNIREVALAMPAKDAAANFRDGIRYCGSETGLVAVVHHGIPDCGQERSDGSLTCDMYLPSGMGMGRSELVLGIVSFKPSATGSTATLKVQTYAARNHNVLNAWEKFAQGKHQDVCK